MREDRLVRSLAGAILCGGLLLGCGDDGIFVRGRVLDPEGEPVETAAIFVGDRTSDGHLDAYLRGDDSAALSFGRSTDAEGTFEYDRILGGSGRHDVWLVIRKETFVDHAAHLWSGSGSPDKDEFVVEVTLRRAPADDEGP